MAKTRGIRLNTEEEKLIQEFLKRNPFFDFSTLARTALRNFIQNPELRLTGVPLQKKNREIRGSQ